jgi:aminomethyltransferase
MADDQVKRTPLFDTHVAAGARMVPFAGYDMPVQYKDGIIAEHNWTRNHAGLFDVSHMGQCFIVAESFERAAEVMETLVPADIKSLAPLQQRYSQLLANDGGILDDLMISRMADGRLYVVVNAACKDADYVHIARHLPADVKLERRDDLALIALQGPDAEAALATLNPKVKDLAFMHFVLLDIAGVKDVHVSRSGYTGEDGFELSMSNADSVTIWNALLKDERVKPIGLGARDSLRLEAGLCLYGHDIDTTTSPIEAGLQWSIAKRRRDDGGFPGSKRVQLELKSGPARKRVGLRPDSRAPAREGTVILSPDGKEIGRVTSGGFGPTLSAPLSMGYVRADFATPGTLVKLVVRDKEIAAVVEKLPFVPNRFKR